MNIVFKIIHNIVAYILFILVVLLFFIPLLLLVACTPEKYRHTNKLIFWLLHMCYQGVAWATLVPTKMMGIEYIPHTPAIFVANHESALDIPFFGLLVGTHPHVWYVLDYYMHKPVIGFFVRRMGISVNQQSSTEAARSLVRGIRLVEDTQSHTMIFPEGGRWNDGMIHDFFCGFAMIAKRTGQPVVPVYMRNLGTVLPRKKMILSYAPITMIIGKPFMYEATDTDEIFAQRIREWFIEQTHLWQ